jgi:hypothetical protein
MSGGCCSSVRPAIPIHLSNSPGIAARAGLARFAPDKRYRPVSLRRRVRRRLWGDPLRPEKEPRARGTPGVQLDPRASTPRDIEACRSPVCLPACSGSSKGQGVPQVRQTLGVPRAVFNRLAPRPPRWSSLSSLGRLPPWSGPGTRQRFCDGSLPPTGHHEPAACDGHARTGAAWAAGPSHRISDARSCPGHRSPPRVWRR